MLIASLREEVMHRWFHYGRIFVTACALTCTGALAEPPIVIKLSHAVSPDTAKGKAALKFKELADSRSNGKVRVEVFPNGTLFNDADELEALQLGSVQMLIPAVAKFGPLGLTDFDVFDLPYMFSDLDALHRVTRGPIGRGLLGKLAGKGIVGLSFWDNAFAIFSANKPLHRPEDMKGLKMRSYSKIIDAQYRALHAIPQTMAFSEVYQALQSGVVDGLDTVPVNMATQKLYEVQKHGVLTFHHHPVYALIANKKWWDGLPAEARKTLEEAVAESTRYNDEIAQKENAEAVEFMRKSGKIEIYRPSPAELDAWRKALLPVHQQMESRIPKDLFAAIYKETRASK
jgi:C4-dicarboxylate-binding protein DctP